MRSVRLEDLAKETTESFVPRPERVNLTDLDVTADENAVVRVMRRQAQADRIWAKDNLALAAGLAEKPRELQEKHEVKLAAFRESYQQAMADETPSYRRAVWGGTFDQRLSGTASTRFEAQEVINGLVRDGLFMKNDSGPFIVFDVRYSVPPASTFKEIARDIPDLLKAKLIEEHPKGVLIVSAPENGPGQVARYRTVLPPEKSEEPKFDLPQPEDEELEEEKESPLPLEIRENYELAVALEAFIRRFRQASYEVRTKGAEVLFNSSELFLREFLSGKPGAITLGIPPEQVFEDGSKKPVLRTDNGEPMWRGGGTLLVRNDGGKVFPVNAIGSIERGVNQAKDMGVYVPHDRLLQDSLGYLEGFSREEYSKIVLLWHLLRRGIAAARKEQELKDQKAELTESLEPLVSMAEFLLDRKIGYSLIDLERPWEPHVGEGEEPIFIKPFFFVAERFCQGEGEDQNTFIRWMRAPQPVEMYLAACSEDYPDNDRFSACPQPLRAVLQSAFGQVQKERSMAGKYGHNDRGK